ncbi:hypothetical protein IP90_02373 [Luteimonas cucumeris]|uniref:Uncharacterized protein n=2 Tax=Luteimonas cucumeris TaxID=985012 RepID=A0A562L2F5_9GAMM|nr:hypothetical protein IP90_02373 [Luteimonas cucumeris]
MPPATMAPDLRRLSKRELYARYADLQQRAHACYEEGIAFDQASAKAAPLITQADAVATEIVRRARRTARWSRALAYAAAAIAVALIVWRAVAQS